MPVLPIVDLLIFVAWSSIFIGAILKAIYLTTSYRPMFLGMTPLDCLVMAGVFLIFALALAARAWLKANEPAILARRRRMASENGMPLAFSPDDGLPPAGAPPEAHASPPSAAAGR